MFILHVPQVPLALSVVQSVPTTAAVVVGEQRCTQRPGELVFVPEGWQHSTRNVGGVAVMLLLLLLLLLVLLVLLLLVLVVVVLVVVVVVVVVLLLLLCSCSCSRCSC